MWASSEPEESTSLKGRASPPLEGGEALSDFNFDYHSDAPAANSAFGEYEDTTDATTPGLPKEVTLHLLQHVDINKDDVLDADIEAQFTSTQSFLDIIGTDLNPRNSFTHNFLQSIISSLDSKDPVVANAWLETLLDVIDLLPKEVIRKDILNVVVSRGQLTQPITSRLSCCKMIGKICTKFEPYLIKKEILPLVQSLCQDTDYEVRGCMCCQLDAVARGMGFDAAKTSILPELVELANDEETYVRLAAIETVINLLNTLDDETSSHIIVPLVKKFCHNSLRNEDATLTILSFNLGKLCHGLSANLSFENKQWFIDYFQQLSCIGLSDVDNSKKPQESESSYPMPDLVPLKDTQIKYIECRRNCAYNFPAMVLFSGPQYFSNGLYKTFNALCLDPCFTVRRTIAYGFHEIAKLLGPLVEFIYDELLTLLKDNSIEVLKGLIPQLPDTLEAFSKQMLTSSKPKLSNEKTFIQALIQCEATTSQSYDWRLHSMFLDKMACLTRCLSNDDIFSEFVPLFVKKLHIARQLPCRISAAKTLLAFLKLNRNMDERHKICQILIKEFCHGHSCRSRSLFIDCCFVALELFSKSFFKKIFFKELLSLGDDKVVNIRLRLCTILPRIKSILKLPYDKDLLQLLESCIGNLMANETDKDVSAAIQAAILELDQVEVMVESLHLSQNMLLEEDHEDLKKEEEENAIEMEFNMSKLDSPKKTSEVRTVPGGKIPIRKFNSGASNLEKRPMQESNLKHSKSSSCLKTDYGSMRDVDDFSTSLSTIKSTMKTSTSSSSLNKKSDSQRRCSMGSFSRIPSPCSSPLPRRQSYESLNSRIPSPTLTTSPILSRSADIKKMSGYIPQKTSNLLKTRSDANSSQSKLQGQSSFINSTGKSTKSSQKNIFQSQKKLCVSDADTSTQPSTNLQECVTNPATSLTANENPARLNNNNACQSPKLSGSRIPCLSNRK